MNEKTNKKTGSILYKSLLFLVVGFLLVSSEAFARPHHHGKKGHKTSHQRALNVLPRRHSVVRIGPKRFYYKQGRFYRKARRGYFACPAPIGAVVATLPGGFSILAMGGTKYFHFGGVYYRRHPNGYVVVEPRHTKRHKPKRPRGERYHVSVATDTLNIRSGPSRNYEVVYRVYYGEVLEVLNYDDGWLYVRLPNGQRGWTMERYTLVYRRRADG
jgi:uncharacterized protein YgiM (DUF1202 family)